MMLIEQIHSLIEQINWIAVLVGTAVSYALGGLWFSAKLFGRTWMDAQPHRGADDYQGQALPMLVQLAATLLLAMVVVWMQAVGGIVAVALLLAMVASSMIAGALFLGQKPGVWLVSTGYSVAMIVIVSACAAWL